MNDENCKKATKNKLESILKTLRNYNAKMEEDKHLRPKIREYLTNHNVFNLPLLRRFANPIKDPDPLASTMIALSYKYPIVVKTDRIKDLGLSSEERKELIEPIGGLTRRPGWTGCKKEAVSHYLKNAPLPDDTLKETINLLYEVEDKKAMAHANIKIESIKVGGQSESREKIALQTPVIEGIPTELVESVIVKTLSPNYLCGKRVQKIYEENKDVLMKLIPDGVALTEQASALRAALDTKERHMPILNTRFHSEIYQHSTTIFSNWWQAEVSDKSLPERYHTHKDKNMTSDICEGILKCLKMYGTRAEFVEICRSLRTKDESIYSMVESSMENKSIFVQYLRGHLGMGLYNGMQYRGRFGLYTIGFNDYNQESEKDVLHLSTGLLQTICHMGRDSFNMHTTWGSYLEMREMYFLLKAIQKIYYEALIVKVSIEEEIHSIIMENSKNWEDNILGRMKLTQKMAKIESVKIDYGMEDNYSIHSEISPDTIRIDRVVAAGPPIYINTYMFNRDGLASFTLVNALPMMNISFFIPRTLKTCNWLNIDEDRATIITKKETSPFLQCIEVKQRFLIVIKAVASKIDEWIQVYNAEEKIYPYWIHFKDSFPEDALKKMQRTCHVLAAYHRRNRNYETVQPEVLALWFMFSSGSDAKTLTTKINMEKGLFIDLDFNKESKNENNALWIDGLNNLRCFSYLLRDESVPMEGFMRVVLANTQYPGYRMEVYKSSKVEEIREMDEAVHWLEANDDNETAIVSYMGIILKMRKDPGLQGRREQSFSRVLRSLKRSVYLGKDGITALELKRVKRD